MLRPFPIKRFPYIDLSDVEIVSYHTILAILSLTPDFW